MDTDMQAAIEAFMLGKSRSGVPASPQIESRPVKDDKFYNRRKSGYRPILKAYQGRIEEWKDTNRQLEGVLRSIANLRDRLYWESSRLRVPSVGTEAHNNATNRQSTTEGRQGRGQQPSWRDCGFRSSLSKHKSSGGPLRMEDIDLALNHDLLRHERMMSALRSLLASLAKTVDDIGRRLDEWMMHNLMDQDHGHGIWITEDEKIIAARTKEQKALELAQDLYSLLASDLYRKQTIGKQVIDSCHDGLLPRGDDTSSTSSDDFLWVSDPRHVIKTASKQYPTPQGSDPTWNAVNQLMSIP
mmetsp:Transcript_15122/g.32494  ORF Transcript_15122/g.32494 Transcript_15122/m.32494 type:complete len:300 (-) Transcript_15122:2747-3646(-)|eukprot:CAMPEP_0168186290 /NCGR_PEP_ID=MMETSP0139_2-20121125/14342_1 /TAXON_ID=44445 /ORGANISM="Pseudo-nitzschia australis, Strain 10249 10 AB" /LENGTH=299 /DNA_ID=CAMNT_0008108265 /DNA_START=517 /DNA_END=1416 /DNA_ORIENTATION=+